MPTIMQEAMLSIENGLPVALTLDAAPQNLLEAMIIYRNVKYVNEHGGTYNP